MHDFSLGPAVDAGGYDGPLLKGKPLHEGNCEDGVYGCRKCSWAAKALTDEQLVSIGWPLTNTCDWCHKEVPFRSISGIRPSDEPSCYYEVCLACRRKQREFELQDLE